MRTALVIACAVTFAFAAWSNIPDTAHAKQHVQSTIDTFIMMTSTTNLPSEEFPAF